MSYVVTGLAPDPFIPLFGLSDDALAERGALRRVVERKPGYPCRVTLEDAEPGDSVLLLNHESHAVATPFRSAYAIYVNETAREQRRLVGELPGVLTNRVIALRVFDGAGMLIGAELAQLGEVEPAIERAFARDGAAYLHAHNAAAGCYSARIDRG